MFVKTFDELEKEKLSKIFTLLKEEVVDNKKCWVFVIDNDISKNKNINFSNIDNSKCFITNKLSF